MDFDYRLLQELIVNSAEEIKTDFANNIFHWFPLVVIANPEHYNPPFITNFHRLLRGYQVSEFIVSVIDIVCLFADIFYGFFRLFFSLAVCGFTSFVNFTFFTWLLITILYRWDIINLKRLDLSVVL